jgi:hypothetical protein
MLQHLKRRSSLGIQRDDLTVDYRAVRFQLGTARGDRRVDGGKIPLSFRDRISSRRPFFMRSAR